VHTRTKNEEINKKRKISNHRIRISNNKHEDAGDKKLFSTEEASKALKCEPF